MTIDPTKQLLRGQAGSVLFDLSTIGRGAPLGELEVIWVLPSDLTRMIRTGDQFFPLNQAELNRLANGPAGPDRSAARQMLARQQGITEFMATGEKVSLAEMGIDADGKPRFNNGRNRFILARDTGATRIPVAVPKSDVAKFAKLNLISPVSPGALTFNEVFFDSVIRHQIGLMRLSGSIRNRIIALLDATEQDMSDKVRSRLIGRRGLNTPADVIRMQRLIKVLRGTRIKAWKQVTALWVKEMQALAVAEPGFMDGLLKSSVPVVLDTVIPQTSFLKAIVTSKPFEGLTMKQWADSIARSDLTRIEQSIRIGMVQGETGPQIARRIVGTKRLRGMNGTTEITRRHATAITRTAVNGIANHAKRLYYVENSDLFKNEIYVATLDSSTTHICMSLDGNKYNLGEGPIPPVHIQCRSMRVAVVTPEVVGKRPIREFTKQGLVRDYSRQNGLKVQGSRAKLPRGHKGAFDSFAQKRMRDLTGRAPAKTTYQQFLTRQTAEFQNDVLGVTRGKLFRDGGLTLDKFVDHTGKLFTLDQLAVAHAAAFKAAGVTL